MKMTRGGLGASVGVSTILLFVALAYIACIFPPVNWPDERRNLVLLEEGNYGVVYGHVQLFVKRAVEGILPHSNYSDAARGVVQSNSWHMADGDLRYREVASSMPPAYYIAKFANILLIFLFCGVFYVATLLIKGVYEAKVRFAHYVLSLLTPSVCYQLMQVSTDLLFILMSVAFYFLESKRTKLLFSAVCLALVLEDRSFAILACIALANIFAPALLPWTAVGHGSKTRATIIFFGCLLAAVAGSLLGAALSSGALGNALALAVQGDLDYTYTKSFNPWQSPVILYAGLVYLPGATEFFVRSIPLFVLAFPVFWRLSRLSLTTHSPMSRRFFYLLVSVLPVFFFLTNLTHVFEAGRYYYVLIPALVYAAASMFRPQPMPYVTSPRILLYGALALGFLSVMLTTLIALPTAI